MAYKSPADILTAVINTSTSADLNVRISAYASTALPVSTGTISAAATIAAPLSTLLEPYDTVVASMQTAAAASTAYQLPTQACVSVAVKARPGNTGNVWVAGASTVSHTSGYPLDASEGIALRVSNVNLLWYWCDTAGDKICWITIS